MKTRDYFQHFVWIKSLSFAFATVTVFLALLILFGWHTANTTLPYIILAVGFVFSALAAIILWLLRHTHLQNVILEDSIRNFAASEKKYRSLFESAYDSILVTDSKARIQIINGQLSKTFGFSAEELIGKPIEFLIPDRFRSEHQQKSQSYMTDAHSRPMGQGLDLYGRRKDGTEFPVDICLSPNTTSDGLQVTAIVRDMTERKRLEDQNKFLAEISQILAETMVYDERLQKMADATVPKVADMCVVSLIEESEIRFKAIAIKDKAKLDLLKSYSVHYKPQENENYSVSYMLRSGKPLLIEDVDTEILKKSLADQEQRRRIEIFGIVSYVVVPLIVRGKTIGTMTLSMSDSGRRFSDRDLEFVASLALRCATAIDNAKLYVEAQQAIKAREAILSVVSHDLKNPVAAIDMAAQILDLSDEPNRENIITVTSKIRSSTSSMQRLISDLLDFGKIQAGNLSVESNTVAIETILEEALGTMSEQFREKGVQLTVDIPKGTPNLNCDPGRIVQVLWNLLGNAIKFTPRGGRVSLTTALKSEMIQFTVTDTGPGLQPEDIDKVFNCHWQAKKTAHQGHGLGLFIAKGIVEAHQGNIWVESNLGHGCKFNFTIPISRKFQVALPKQEQKPTSFVGDKCPLKGVYVLVVDDTPENLILLRMLLEKAGAKVSDARCLNDALEIVMHDCPDVLITDIEMPEGNGYELIKKIRELNRKRKFQLPVAALTAHTSEEELKKIDEAGFDDSLSKPISLERLVTSIRHMVGDHLQH